MKIPRELRNMTLGELERKWGGSWAGTLMRIKRDEMEDMERREREREVLEKVEKGKRWVRV